jgi:hypothetical protein
MSSDDVDHDATPAAPPAPLPEDAAAAQPSPEPPSPEPPSSEPPSSEETASSLRARISAEPRTVQPVESAGDEASEDDAENRRLVPPVDPAAPLDPQLQLTPAEIAAREAAPPPPPSRRFVLGTAALVLLGAGGGVGWSFWRTRSHTPRVAPPALIAAARAERALLAAVDADLTAHPDRAALLRQIRADHAAHAAALDAAIADHVGRRPTTSTPAPTQPAGGTLLTAERSAATAAARRAGQLTGRDAVLLASIAACEAGHAAVLA